MPREQEPFEPVLLNLDIASYSVLTNALRDFAVENDGLAEDEGQRIRDNNLPETASNAEAFTLIAQHARALLLDIERQIDANSAARRSREP